MSELIEQTSSGYVVSRLNATKHGILSLETVLPNESKTEYDELLNSFLKEYAPQGPTETALVEDMVTTLWRKRRIFSAERANVNSEMTNILAKTTRLINSSEPLHLHVIEHVYEEDPMEDSIRKLLAMSTTDVANLQEQCKLEEAAIAGALRRLETGGRSAAREALEMLPEDYQSFWYQEEREGQTINAAIEFLETEVAPALKRKQEMISNIESIRNQAVGIALKNLPYESFARYEAHLDRKFERSLAMLLKLRELRVSKEVFPDSDLSSK